jgi:transposase
MSVLYGGLDAHSRTCTAAIRNSEGSILTENTFETSGKNIIEFFTELDEEVSVHLEEGELAAWIHYLLRDWAPNVDEVVVSNPKTCQWIAADRKKGDRVDAKKLSELLRLGRTDEVFHPEDYDLIVFKRTVQHYEAMNQEQIRIKQRLKGRLRTEGVICRGRDVYSQDGRKTIIEKIPNKYRRQEFVDLYECLDFREAMKEKALKKMKQQGKEFEIIERLIEIPGVGMILACRFVGHIMTPERFPNIRKYISYCRLDVEQPTSGGEPVGPERLSQEGNGSLKDLSRSVFQNATRKNMDNGIKRFYEASLGRTGDEDNARLNTQRKILSAMWSMWKKGTRYNDKQMG